MGLPVMLFKVSVSSITPHCCLTCVRQFSQFEHQSLDLCKEDFIRFSELKELQPCLIPDAGTVFTVGKQAFYYALMEKESLFPFIFPLHYF